MKRIPPQTFTDRRSQAQIAKFRAYEIVAAREYNAANLKRWTDHHREQWELTHIGDVHRVADRAAVVPISRGSAR